MERRSNYFRFFVLVVVSMPKGLYQADEHQWRNHQVPAERMVIMDLWFTAHSTYHNFPTEKPPKAEENWKALKVWV